MAAHNDVKVAPLNVPESIRSGIHARDVGRVVPRPLLCDALRTLFKVANLGDDLWSGAGPSGRALALYEADGGPLDAQSRAVLLVAFTVWKRSGTFTVAELMNVATEMEMLVASATIDLLASIARGPVIVDTWLRTYGDPPVGVPPQTLPAEDARPAAN